MPGSARRKTLRLVGDLAKGMLGRTFCPLGDAAAMPTSVLLRNGGTSSKSIFQGSVRIAGRYHGRCPLKGFRDIMADSKDITLKLTTAMSASRPGRW